MNEQTTVTTQGGKEDYYLIVSHVLLIHGNDQTIIQHHGKESEP